VTPWILVVAGPPCSGKSAVASWLREQTGAEHLEMDAMRQRILPEAAHTRADRQVAYRAMHRLAAVLVRQNACSILDATYRHRSDRRDLADELAAMLEMRPEPFFLAEFRVTPATALARHRRRGRDARLDLTDHRVAQLVTEHAYADCGLLLDSEKLSIESLGQRVLRALEEGQRMDIRRWVDAAPDEAEILP
jgi:predicted kinase